MQSTDSLARARSAATYLNWISRGDLEQGAAALGVSTSYAGGLDRREVDVIQSIRLALPAAQGAALQRFAAVVETGVGVPRAVDFRNVPARGAPGAGVGYGERRNAR